MRLTKQSNSPPQKKEQKVNPPMSAGERALFKIKMDEVLPYGKFKGKTIGHIVKNEQWYHEYLENNGLMIQWGLLALIDEPVRKPKPKLWEPWYNADTGETYMGIREIPMKTLPVDERW